ncbi:hypothetical protein [Streptomyces griseorubiginosus]|uniref:hypothetical protein n=1 Tax=Streptomyces griseorubiginosus TaxID=67304 RepID=UPI00113FD4AD|nr:hypothetical protein [Streptomyces griseorubiginosus]
MPARPRPASRRPARHRPARTATAAATVLLLAPTNRTALTYAAALLLLLTPWYPDRLQGLDDGCR